MTAYRMHSEPAQPIELNNLVGLRSTAHGTVVKTFGTNERVF